MQISSNTQIKAENIEIIFNKKSYRSDSFRDLFTGYFRANRNNNKLVATDKISFEIKDGEKIGIIGPNGAGKTTLARCLAGLLIPNSGELFVKSQTRAIFSNSFMVDRELTGRENTHLLAQYFYPEIEPIIVTEDVASISGLADAYDQPMKTYSTGMIARMGLSLATHHSSKILIIDEAFHGADASFMKIIQERIQSVIDQSSTSIIVSHSENILLKSCNRIWVYDRGKIVFDGQPGDALQFYKKNFV